MSWNTAHAASGGSRGGEIWPWPHPVWLYTLAPFQRKNKRDLREILGNLLTQQPNVWITPNDVGLLAEF